MDTPSENFRTLPNDAEAFRKVPNDSENFGKVPNVSERTENHTLTVREVARQFEDAGVARTERSIVNWCRKDANGYSRLDCAYDINDHKYFITPQSVERAIEEEKARARVTEHTPSTSERFGTHVPHTSEAQQQHVPHASEARTRQTHDETMEHSEMRDETRQGRELRAKVRRLEIDNEVSKRYIERLESEREKFFDMMNAKSHQIGMLEAEKKFLETENSRLLESPRRRPSEENRSGSERPSERVRDAEFFERDEPREETDDTHPIHP